VPGVRFVVPVASSVDPSALGGLDDAARVASVQDVSAADVAVVCSGTATLELAVLGVPMVLVYQASTIDWAIGSRLALVRSVGLPNLVAGESIVPEHVQDLDAERITDDAVRLLGVDGDVQRAALRGVVARLGGPGAVGRAADEVERWLPGGRREP
jgi:lipid-A-disaccharide synthase